MHQDNYGQLHYFVVIVWSFIDQVRPFIIIVCSFIGHVHYYMVILCSFIGPVHYFIVISCSFVAYEGGVDGDDGAPYWATPRDHYNLRLVKCAISQSFNMLVKL